VRFCPAECDLSKSNIVVAVWKGDEKIGTLLISQGAVVWQPKNKKKKFKMDWTKFDGMMREGYKVSEG
jgi:hypothetical protein